MKLRDLCLLFAALAGVATAASATVETGVGVYIPPSLFANLPTAAAAGSGTMLRVTDIGSGGTVFVSNGSIWRPLNGVAVLGSSAVRQTLTGTTAQTTLASVSIPGNLLTANGMLRITSLWTMSNNSNNKTLNIYYGSTAGTAVSNVTLTTSASWQAEHFIQNRGVTNSQVYFQNAQSGVFGTTGGANGTSTIDSTTGQQVLFTGTLSSSSDTISLERYTVELVIP